MCVHTKIIDMYYAVGDNVIWGRVLSAIQSMGKTTQLQIRFPRCARTICVVTSSLYGAAIIVSSRTQSNDRDDFVMTFDKPFNIW